MFDAGDSQIIGGIATILLSLFHLTLLQEAGLISATYAGQFFGAWAFGYAAERWGRKTAFIGACSILGGLSLVCAIAPDYNTLFWARVVQGFGLGGEVPVAGALMGEVVGRRRRGFMVQVYEGIFFGIGATVMSTALALFITLFGQDLAWRLTFALGFTPLPWALLCIFTLPESPRWLLDHEKFDRAEKLVAGAENKYTKKGVKLAEPVMRAGTHADIQKTKVLELFSKEYRRRTLLTFTLWFSTYYAAYGFSLFQPTIYVQIGHITLVQALLITPTVTAFTLLGLPIQVWHAYLTDKLGRRFMVCFGLTLSATTYFLGYVLFVIVGVTGWWWIYSLGAVAAMNYTGFMLYTYNPELYPTRMRAYATAAGSSMNRLASAVSAPINAILLGGAVSATAMTIAGLGNVYLLIAAVQYVGAFTAIVLAPETAGRQLEEISK